MMKERLLDISDEMRCDHGVRFTLNAAGTKWSGTCYLCSLWAWADQRMRRITCFIRTHEMHTEYRCSVDYYGESWCQRCGEYEPDHWLSDNGDFRAAMLTALREPEWYEKRYALEDALRWLRYYARRFAWEF